MSPDADAPVEPLLPSNPGIRTYDLALPSNPLGVTWQPLRNSPSAAEQNEARRAERERPERLARELAAAEDEWRQYADRHAGNPVARAAFDIHQPDMGYERVICAECRESDCDDTVGVTWPCATYAAMKGAADA